MNILKDQVLKEIAEILSHTYQKGDFAETYSRQFLSRPSYHPRKLVKYLNDSASYIDFINIYEDNFSAPLLRY